MAKTTLLHVDPPTHRRITKLARQMGLSIKDLTALIFDYTLTRLEDKEIEFRKPTLTTGEGGE